jgi:hypothetical protein
MHHRACYLAFEAMDYEVPLLRRLALGLHARMLSTQRALDRAGDVGAVWFMGFIPLGLAGLAGALWLPIANFGLDVLIWAGLWALANAGLCLLLRRARRNRFGSAAPSHDVSGVADALTLIATGWFGVAALAVCVSDVSTQNSPRGWVAGLVGAGLLIPVLIVAYRYATRAPKDEDPAPSSK